MSYVGGIPTAHIPSASAIVQSQPTADAVEGWPELNPSKPRNAPAAIEDDDWEILIESRDVPVRNDVSFETEAVRIEGTADVVSNPRRLLKHCQSSPDLRKFSFEETYESGYTLEEEEDASGVLIGDNETTSLASSSIVWVSEPGTGILPWHNSRRSFRDAILHKAATTADTDTQALEDTQEADTGDLGSRTLTAQPVSGIRKLRKPKYVVKPIRRCTKSTGDLKSLTRIVEDVYDDVNYSGHVLGETDAQEFYNRKALGKNSRINGLKTRPDEAKRLQISMAKKQQQRQQQQQAASGKR